MTYQRISCEPTDGGLIEISIEHPNRGLIATIDPKQNHYVTPTAQLSVADWSTIEMFLRDFGLKKKARRSAMAARWGDTEAFLEALYGLEDPR